jgi:GH35 family endo-1,4-beta-xylanase
VPLNNPHASNVLFALEVSSTGMVSVMVVETDLQLNVKHPRHEAEAVNKLLMDAREYLETNADQVTNIKIVSICDNQV